MVLNDFQTLTKAACKPWEDQILVHTYLRKGNGHVISHCSSPIKLKNIQHSNFTKTCFSEVFSDNIFIARISEYWLFYCILFFSSFQLTEAGSGINCLDSMCCFSDGETACTSVRRMLERLMGRCSPTRVNRCGISLNSLCCRRFSYKLEPDEPAAIDV